MLSKSIFTLIISLLSMTHLTAQNVNTNADKVANNGYDVVNYFTSNSAARGSADYSTAHHDATYYFCSAENLAAFKAAPEKYLPQFDGYCAFAVGMMSQKSPVDPETFRIDDGKLYLFYNDFYEGKPFNTIIPWLANEEENEAKAVSNWKGMK